MMNAINKFFRIFFAMLQKIIVSFFSFLILGSSANAQQGPAIDLYAGLYKIHAEVAKTEKARQLGLMHRTYMPADDGMLFIFEQSATHCFWMRNTKIPLAIAFIADDGKIVNILEMKAMTEDNHCPTKPVRFALEMNQGWFSKKGVLPGHTITGLPKN
jgi:uncharacterized membrane protein (UPF0127 family)